ncbi:MAG: tRNA (guanine-N7)-methyltransferase [Bdellovibrionaceae bacterium]|nr:tRNA (guanine-N7)-methyltransferase [Pseudobdellovibrionaceae bacterium]
MELPPRRRIALTRLLPRPNKYTLALDGEYAQMAFNEERAPLNRGKWREVVFQKPWEYPMDLEIGTGAGYFFAHQAAQNPERLLVGIELKYKPLIQSIRRALRAGANNVAICRYHAFNVYDLFADGELNNVYIHHPDPWVTPNKPRNRILNRQILGIMHRLQRSGSFIEFKTDSREYFYWALDEIKASPYRLGFMTTDLHSSEKAEENFVTGFERIFLQQGIEINYLQLWRD